MKAQKFDVAGKKVSDVDLPSQFEEAFRPDLIKQAVLTIQANSRQAYGAKPDAGLRQRGKLSRRRRKYKGAYGKGISRVPRKTLTARGTQFYHVGSTVPSNVSGRRAHPPKAEKNWSMKLNITERKKAIRSALNATTILEVVKARGHKTEATPFVVDAKIEDVQKAKDIKTLFEKLGLKEELTRVSTRKVRPGKGTMRGRKYKTRTGPLVIVSGKCKLTEGASNLPGVETVIVNDLNAENLAPGTEPGRLCIWSEKALEKVSKENLFTKKTRTVKTAKKEDKK